MTQVRTWNKNAKARSDIEMIVNSFWNYILEANNSISKPYNQLDNSQEQTSLFTKNMVVINMYNSELNNTYDLWLHDSPS
jgi:hypothetical protein